MRKILFRGKDPDENRWYYGSYWKTDKTTFCFGDEYEPDNTEHFILFDQMTDWNLPNRKMKANVIPETVGQYTGLTDKNGKKIFEGDIIKTKEYGKIVGHSNINNYDIFTVIYEPCTFRLINKTRGFNLVDDVYSKLEIIGNIHDNPELMKGE